jgi:protease II
MRKNFVRNSFPIAWLLCLAFFFFPQHSLAQSSADKNVLDPQKSNSNYFEEYERRLNAILKTRRDDEKVFVKQVVEKIKEDKLPVKLIDSSFEWVRNQRPGTDYPFYYFERVLRIHATELGLQDEIPAFDYANIQIAGYSKPGQQLNAGSPTETQKKSLLNRFFRFSSLFGRSDD